MNNLGERIAYLRKLKDYTMQDLADACNISKSYVNDIEKSRVNPSVDTLQAIAKALHSTVSFLLGESVQSSKSIPVLGSIRAGLPLLAEENWESQVEVPADLDADFALRVKGDSMSWVGIHEGDLAILCHDNTASHGMIVAAGIEEMEWSATLKFYIKENGTPVLRAANPNYKDIPIDSKHRIIGHVVSVMKESPSILTYKNFLASKELSDEGWNEVIENAVKHGLDNKQVSQMIDLFSHMVKQIK